ncbi:MAG TPA: NADH-quinone oxidoreductase subunit J [Prolixibacteraceae bacterium]|nr:NADH-quinone oxidoreductase subunit J [Prolixibacteraceae bacterium]
MALNQFMFYLLAAVIMVCSVLTITSRRILRAAFYLLCVLIATAGIYFMLDYQFIAGVQLILYAGGIVVLIIFSVLLTSHISQKFAKPGLARVIPGVLAAVAGFVLSAMTVLSFPFQPSGQPAIGNDMRTIGLQLLSVEKNGYALPFEVISVLLLASMVGAIVVAKKEKSKEKP